jgi:hypothetical protein
MHAFFIPSSLHEAQAAGILAFFLPMEDLLSTLFGYIHHLSIRNLPLCVNDTDLGTSYILFVKRKSKKKIKPLKTMDSK